MQTVLITGASGFIGNYAHPVISECYAVQTLSLRGRDFASIELSKVNKILFLTGKAHQMEPIPDREYFAINYELALDFAKAAKAAGVSQFIYVSSVKVYGDSSDEILDETSPCTPTDAYGRSKLQAELALEKLSSDGFSVAIVRPPLVYGPGSKGNLDRLQRLIKKFPAVPFGAIKNERSMVFVGNLAALFLRILQANASGVYIAGDRSYTSTTELVETMISNMKSNTVNVAVPGYFWRLVGRLKPDLHLRLVGTYRISNVSTNRRLDFTPPFTFREGMRIAMEAPNSHSPIGT